jgi:hypothetical protein
VVESYEHSNESSTSMKGGEFLDQLSDCYLQKKDFAPGSYLVSQSAPYIL